MIARILCRIGRHCWFQVFNDGPRYEYCVHCGRHKYPGWVP